MRALNIANILLRPPRLFVSDAAVDSVTLSRAVDEITALVEKHLPPNRRVALVLGNSAGFVAALLGVIAAEASAVLVNPALAPNEIDDALKLSDADLVITASDFAFDRLAMARQAERIADVDLGAHGALRLRKQEGTSNVSPIAEREFVVQFTSGVSGLPAAVARTTAQAAIELANYIPRAELTEQDTVVVPVPAFHSFGLFAGLLASLAAGAECILLANFGPAALAEVLRSRRPSVLLGVPLMYEVLSRSQTFSNDAFAQARLLLSAGAPLANDVAQTFAARFGKNIAQVYGTTETGIIALNAPRTESVESVGKPLASNRLRLRAENGAGAGVGEEGEIEIQSEACARSYLKRPELTAAKFQDGWYRTGDLGRMTADGTLFITGRKSAFINVAGMKVDPVAVENVIKASGEAEDCAVVGIARPEMGEFIRAYVVLKPQGDLVRLKAHCSGHLAAYKMPREFRAVAELPRSATGKILRKYLVDGVETLPE
jgi:acyl-CoA synthetase (AMP-forming)/AMP-acid ligase II